MTHAKVLFSVVVGLLCATASADDDKDKKPAPPVDVPGFWTADELRRIDEGLDVLNCTRKDLGFQKRPIDDPFRLPVVNQILDEPLSIGPVAAEWDAVARSGDPAALIEHALALNRLPNGHMHDALVGAGAVGETEAGLSKEVRETIRSLFWSDGLWCLDIDLPAGVARKALLSQVEKPQVPVSETALTDAQFLERVAKLNFEEFASTHEVLAKCEQLVRALQKQHFTWIGRQVVKTQGGRTIVIYGVGDDVHGPEDDDADLVIDLGGNDTYTHGASVNILKTRPLPPGLTMTVGDREILSSRSFQVVIDLAGDDRYLGENDFSFGGALGGVAIQWDCGGNDTYRGGNCSCGAGILGVGVLVDEGGDDVYRCRDFCEGAGAFGIGLLLDKAGNDSYHADLFGQGFASTWGCGMLVEMSGNDVYDAGGAHVDTPLWRDRFQSLSQGFSIGMRPDASGGVGVLVDVSGNDRYSCDIFGQGCSYWFSLGLLIDDDGHDTYACGQYGQGSGIHLSCGMLLDRHGQDNYYDANGVGMGGAHDWAVGFLVDREGDDYYSGGGCAQGSGHTNSVGMLIDDAGDDGYSTVRGVTQGSASWTRNTGGIGLLLDGAGKDSYSETTRNDGVAVRDTIGACIDEPTPPDKPSENPMNAAISKEDAAKKVEADGMTDGKWDLDKLWKMVTQWEVGDNTVILPIAREKFVALGKPALDRAFANLNAKDSILTRAIELTLKAFPREDWTTRLIEKTKDPDKIVRKNSVLMVTNLQVSEALPRLTEMLTTDPDTQGGVLAALAALKTAPPEVVALLLAKKESVAVQAAVCLGAVADDDALAALSMAIGPDYAFPVRLAAGEQLAALGAKATPFLARISADSAKPPAWRRNALKALGGTKDVQAWDALRPSFADADAWVRFSAIAAADELLRSASADVRPGLAAELQQVRDAETDPLVKRLVPQSARK